MVTALAQKNEEAAISDWIEGLDLPDSLVECRMILDVDWEGDPKVILYFILPDALGERDSMKCPNGFTGCGGQRSAPTITGQ